MEKTTNNYCVIMAGGVGARFWPMSRTTHPKQFIDILGTGETLIQQTYRRFTRILPADNIFIVTNELYRELVLKQIPGIRQDRILCEPSRRNTAPCIAYANYRILQENPEATIVVAPSDHIILKEEIFLANIQTALEAATENDWLLTLGILPSRPDTGYGYIQYKEGLPYPKDPQLREVRTFTEKPNHDLAVSFLESGDFLWNAGIFIWSLKSIMKAFREFLPEVDTLFSKGTAVYGTADETDFIRDTYSICTAISIDYGIMEKAPNVHVLAVDFGWSDLGTWGSLYEIRPKDGNGNAVVGKNVMLYDATNCIINMPDDKVVVMEGMSDLIVAESDNILLICRKSNEQNIRQFVNDVLLDKGEKFV